MLIGWILVVSMLMIMIVLVLLSSLSASDTYNRINAYRYRCREEDRALYGDGRTVRALSESERSTTNFRHARTVE